MKYQSANSLQDFMFHDAECFLSSYDDGVLVVDVKYLNIKKKAAQNIADCDMEIRFARITFRGCEIISYERGAPWKTDAEGKAYPAEPLIIYTNHEARELFLHELSCTTTVYAFEQEECGTWKIEGCGNEPYFEARISFDSVTVEWNEFRRPAWYVLRERGIIRKHGNALRGLLERNFGK